MSAQDTEDASSEGYGACTFCHTEACDEVLVAIDTNSDRTFVEVCAMHRRDVEKEVNA